MKIRVTEYDGEGPIGEGSVVDTSRAGGSRRRFTAGPLLYRHRIGMAGYLPDGPFCSTAASGSLAGAQ